MEIYFDMLENMLNSLAKNNIHKIPIMVVTTKDNPLMERLEKLCQVYVTELLYGYSIIGTPNYFFTRLKFWNMTEFDQIMYVDSDGMFLNDVSYSFSACGSAKFCAVGDRGVMLPGTNYRKYFNAGMFILRPDRQFYEGYLLKQLHTSCFNSFLSDQNTFNRIFAKTWKRLNNNYNSLSYIKSLNPNTVFIHDKFPGLVKRSLILPIEKQYPQSKSSSFIGWVQVEAFGFLDWFGQCYR